MTITVEIGPEVQAELSRRAAEHGSLAEAYAAGLLEEALRVPSRQPLIQVALTEDQFEKALREIAIYSGKIPALPDSAFTRESFYQDHE
jgi:plasmid stability protein